jgi:hypothetical protein
MSESPFGRVLSKRELEHRRRMLVHLTSPSATATAVATCVREEPAPPQARTGGQTLLRRGRTIPFCPRIRR